MEVRDYRDENEDEIRLTNDSSCLIASFRLDTSETNGYYEPMNSTVKSFPAVPK